ncbi:U-BOX DOMAIN-CONTAINING PROTEIN 21 [Salix purpurea]|uniref:U-box domain-containing protein n=1 Tax=Salix purpurea TaxID=77065 RepID=A0A9Q0WIY1_SALPP|nr:U-BOX DOMAIN-CONTAINING PROTEIN 21 [Salix purpurea]
MEMIMIPRHFCCPISLDLMKDPVTLSTGITYDRESIDKWIEDGNLTCPVTNQVLPSFDQIPNHSLRKMIQDWGVENCSYGFERIPTPRVPVTPYEVSEICKRVKAATQRGEKRSAKSWLGRSRIGVKRVSATRDALRRMGLVAFYRLASSPLQSGDLSARQNAALVLKNLLALDQRHVNASVEIEGVVESLVKLIKEPICPTATKASLMAIFYMTSSSSFNEKMIPTFVEMGLVSLIIEILVDGDKSICEKALGVLSHICDCKEGREKVYENALIVTVLITKIVSVSNLASELSVSILWKLFKNHKERSGDGDDDAGGVVVEALQVGAIQKLLVLLQVGCGHSTKEKLKELLKLLNQFRVKLGCFDSSEDLKYLKKPY